MGEYFSFRIVKAGNDTEVIDRKRITPLSALTPIALLEYQQVEENLYYMDIQKRKQKRERSEMERQNKLLKNPLFRLVYLCGMI